jgi:hypothetical protein
VAQEENDRHRVHARRVPLRHRLIRRAGWLSPAEVDEAIADAVAEAMQL